ncbi:MAG TPA: helical backbone metal receptor [Armatimonadota bacterium]|nr:helical backbone metal receptor [Armatimonadota bacterium]
MTARDIRRLALAVAATAAIVLAGCRQQAAPPVPPEELARPEPAAVSGPWPRTFTDDLGAEVELPAPPQRIVCISPDMTEIIFTLGAGQRLVGADEFSNYPPETAEIEKIGGMTDPSIEKIIGLQPDLVLVVRGVPVEVVESLREAGLKVIGKAPKTISDVIGVIRDVGSYLGLEEVAARAATALDERVERVKQRAHAMFAETPGPRVLMVIGIEPVFAAGPGSYGDDLITLAGGRNVVTEDDGEFVCAWPQYSLERIVEHDPDIIIATLERHGQEGGTLQTLRGLGGWKDVAAVRNGRVYDLNADELLRSGPRLVDGLEQVAQIIQSGGPAEKSDEPQP